MNVLEVMLSVYRRTQLRTRSCSAACCFVQAPCIAAVQCEPTEPSVKPAGLPGFEWTRDGALFQFAEFRALDDTSFCRDQVSQYSAQSVHVTSPRVRAGRSDLLCLFLSAIHQPDQHWTGDIDGAVCTDEYANRQAEGKTVNSFATNDIQNHDHDERGQ